MVGRDHVVSRAPCSRNCAGLPRPQGGAPRLRRGQGRRPRTRRVQPPAGPWGHGPSYVASGGGSSTAIPPAYITTRITADGRDSPRRARTLSMVVARACPWATGAIIVRAAGSRGRARSASAAPRTMPRNWTSTRTPVASTRCWASRTGCATRTTNASPITPRASPCPRSSAMTTGAVVTNDFAQLTLDLSTEWTALPPSRRPAAVPRTAARREIDEGRTAHLHRDQQRRVPLWIFAGFARGVRRCLRAAVRCPGQVSARLATRRYLVGDTITEADVRLFTTLVWFDPVYHGHFSATGRSSSEMPVLWALHATSSRPRLRRHRGLRADQTPLLRGARRYQPHRIVPAGPDLTNWPHRTAGKRWAAIRSVIAPPGPPREGEQVPVGPAPRLHRHGSDRRARRLRGSAGRPPPRRRQR